MGGKKTYIKINRISGNKLRETVWDPEGLKNQIKSKSTLYSKHYEWFIDYSETNPKGKGRVPQEFFRVKSY